MARVTVNDQQVEIDCSKLGKLADLVELVKATIDPEHMITGITISGREVEDADWICSLGQFGSETLEFETGTPESFVRERLHLAPKVMRSIYNEFKDARKRFQDAKSADANKLLHQAVNALKAFFEWYSALLDLMTPELKQKYDLSEHVTEVSKICTDICQQQLYQSWWALGESIEKRLEPRLDLMEDFLRRQVA